MPRLTCDCGTVIEASWEMLRAQAGSKLACPLCGKVRRLPPITPADVPADVTPGVGIEQIEPALEEVEPEGSVCESAVPLTPAIEFEALDDSDADLHTESEEFPVLLEPGGEPAPPPPEGWAESVLQRWRRAADRQTVSSWSVSGALHVLIGLLLGLWALPGVLEERGVSVEAYLNRADDASLDKMALENLTSAEFATSTPPEQPSRTHQAIHAATGRLVRGATPVTPVGSLPTADRDELTPTSGMDQLAGQDLLETVATALPARSVADGGVTSAGSSGAQGALEGVLNGIRARRREGDLKVVWLIDASISLHHDRQLIADRLKEFYQEPPPAEGDHKYVTAAVAFGRAPREIAPSTRYGQRVASAIREMPVDASGLENVMSAVEYCIARHRRSAKGLMQIVIWTDESGDDILKLEQTIELCRRTRTAVSVVGPSAVLGSEVGSHTYTDPGTGFAFLIPVKRGPDTSLPERIALPYWFESPVPPHMISGAVPALNAPPYGGAYRERLMSGFGPYALTRLALETGGTFTILSRPGDPPEFPFEVMKPYAPDYSSAQEYLHAMRSNRLRSAVSGAVLETLKSGLPQAPPFRFVMSRSAFYPFTPLTPFLSPQAFRTALATDLKLQAVKVAAMLQTIDSALSMVQSESVESVYDSEPNRRWKAWYDLTRGRLLAQKVRHLEYLAVCARLGRGETLRPETNHLHFRANRAMLTGNSSESLVSEALRYLERCVRNNPGTPWELMAKWELEQPAGIAWQEEVIEPPRPIAGPVPRTAPPPVIRLPAL